MGVKSPGKPMPAEMNVPDIDDDLEDRQDALDYSLTNENIVEKELLFSSNNNFYIEYGTDMIMRVSRDASNVWVKSSSRSIMRQLSSKKTSK